MPLKCIDGILTALKLKVRDTALKIAVQCSMHVFNINGENEFVTKFKKESKHRS